MGVDLSRSNGYKGFPGGSVVKNPPTDAEDENSIPGYQEDPLQEKLPAHFSIFGWEIPWMEEPDGLQSTGSQRVGCD